MNESYDFNFKAVEEGDYSEIEKILFKKRARPASLGHQVAILKQIRDLQKIPNVYRINASVAYLYKLMESNSDRQLVIEAVDFIEKNKGDLDEVSESENIRFSYIHLFYSLNYCLIQAYVFLGEKDVFLEKLYSVRETISTINFKNQTSAFYSTHINLVKIILMVLLHEVASGVSCVDSHVLLIIRSSKCASKYIDTNKVRFYEYTKSLSGISKVFDLCGILGETYSIDFENDSVFFDLLHVNKNKKLIAERLKEFLLN